MNTPKIALGTAAVISAVALGTALYIRDDAKEQLAVAHEAQASATARVAELETQLRDVSRAMVAAEAANAKLLAAVESTAAQLKVAPKPTEEPLTKDSVDARYTHAQELDKAGRLEEALAEYLWCYDLGMRRFAGYSGVRNSYLLSNLTKLGERLPAALAALRQRQEARRQRILAGADDLESLQDLASLNRELKEESQTLTLFDSLPDGDARRKVLGTYIYDQLTNAQRYKDAALAKPYFQVSSQFELFANRVPNGKSPEHTESIKRAQRQMVIRQTATSVEVFAGSGDFQHAADLALRLLDYDNSPETVALLEKHAARAGHPNLISTLRAK